MASEAVPFPVEVLPLASAATAPLAAMPGPIVHVKGFRDRILLDGSAPPFALNMRARGELERERQKAEAAVALVRTVGLLMFRTAGFHLLGLLGLDCLPEKCARRRNAMQGMLYFKSCCA